MSGNLRNFDLIMDDRQTQSWWQQFTEDSIVGDLLGTELAILPSRLESWDDFRARPPEGTQVMVAQSVFSTYGVNPTRGTVRPPARFLLVACPRKSRPWPGW